jgi:hypothetical protein
LRADLRDFLSADDELRHVARLGDAVRQRLFAEHMLAGLQRGLAHRHVPALAGRDDHRVDRFLLLEHFPEIIIGRRLRDRVLQRDGQLPALLPANLVAPIARVRVARFHRRQRRRIDVAHCDDVITFLHHGRQNLGAAIPAADDRYVQAPVGGGLAERPRRHNLRKRYNASGGGTGFQKRTTGQGYFRVHSFWGANAHDEIPKSTRVIRVAARPETR